MRLSDCKVLIVGAGPTGLMLALELARQNISFCIIDKNSNVSTIMKASAISSVALEGFDDFNYQKPFQDKGVFTHALSIYYENKPAMHIPWVGIESKYPNYCLLGQNYVEKFQEDLLNQLGQNVHWNVTLVDFVDEESQVKATLNDGDADFTIACDYIIGCDGAHSKVRKLASFNQKGKEYPSHYIIADVKVEGDFSKSDWYFFLANKGFSSIGALPNDRWGILLSLPNDVTFKKDETPSLEFVQSLFDQLSPIGAKLSDPFWISHFHTYLKSVKERKKGRVILCGDAAHQVSPLTSLGMNSGMLDARNLGWKLALVCQEVSPQSILDTYSIEQNQTLKDVKRLSDANERSFAMIGVLTRELRDHLTAIILNLEPAMKLFGGILSQTATSFNKNDFVDEFLGLPIHLTKSSHLSEHDNCFGTWLDFGKGPSAGSRAPDVQGVGNTPSQQENWLYDDLLQGLHCLIVFLGCEDYHQDTIESLNEILHDIEQNYSKWIRTLVITPSDTQPHFINTKGKIRYDTELLAHKRYGASGACLYLVRPDRFIGFRSMPPRLDKLQAYLGKLFRHKT
jgi:2-polyprenyl-6-methoxyphenol hydroxylase-like FAD-dependent oxidoreductase